MKITRTAAAVAAAPTAVFMNTSIAMSGGTSSPLAPADSASDKELSAKWWQWAASTPFSEVGPFGQFGTDCGENQPNGNTWFLAGSFGDPAERSCEIPAGTRLFFPVVNVECSSLETGTPFFGGTVAERGACVQQALFAFEPPFAELDGEPIVSDLDAFTVTSPNFPTAAAPDNAAFIPAGRGVALSRGVWLLPPLGPGDHELHFGAASVIPPSGVHARGDLPPHGRVSRADRHIREWESSLLR
jgi:hypothetical protein